MVAEPLTAEADAWPKLAEILRLIRDMIEILILFSSLKILYLQYVTSLIVAN